MAIVCLMVEEVTPTTMKKIMLLIFGLMCYESALSQCPRKTAYDDYQQFIASTSITKAERAWTGNVSSCVPGTISALAKENTLIRINYFRRLAGVNYPVEHEPLKDSLCQRAALIQEANNFLQHNPPVTSLCYTENGRIGSLNSNLAFTQNDAGPQSVNEFISDDGFGNEAVGHRRWLLWPRLAKVGIGATNNSCAIYVNIGGTFRPYPSEIEYHSYPGKGYIPRNLVYERWSFSMVGANFNNASVEIKKPDGTLVVMEGAPVVISGSEPAIVWTPEMFEIKTNKLEDITYTVSIKDIVVGNQTRTISYDVTLFNPATYPPPCTLGKSWSEQQCACIPDVLPIEELLESSENNLYPNPFEETFSLKVPVNHSCNIFTSEGLLVEESGSGEFELGKEWNPGIYFVKMLSPNGSSTVRKIVKR